MGGWVGGRAYLLLDFKQMGTEEKREAWTGLDEGLQHLFGEGGWMGGWGGGLIEVLGWVGG